MTTQIQWDMPWLRHIPFFLHDSTTDDLYLQLNQHKQQEVGVTLNNLRNANQKRINFIPQAQLPENTAYESHIYATGNIPTRNNLHDLFNACVWFTFPQTKIWLNAMQDSQIKQLGISSARGKLRDALTLFDENGAILVTADNNIASALNRFDWQNALVSPRSKWNKPYEPNANASAEVYIFGHALLEQLVQPRKPLCAHTLTITVPDNWFAQSIEQKRQDLDNRLQAYLVSVIHELHTKFYQPLPILGVPYFWHENTDPNFYDDSFVFRAGRRKK